MSVVLFKDGEQGVFEIHEMTYLLDNGWSTENETQREDEPQAQTDGSEGAKPAEEDKPKEETPEDIRELAKEAGIEGWEIKRIKTLKAELNEQQA